MERIRPIATHSEKRRRENEQEGDRAGAEALTVRVRLRTLSALRVERYSVPVSEKGDEFTKT